MNVGRINHSDYLARRTPPALALPSTDVNFSLQETGPVTLSIYNYHDSLIERPYDNEILGAGSHTLTWDTSDDLPGFYRFEWITTDTTLSSWTTLEVGADPQQTIVGQTDSDGQWATDDTLVIPCLLANPPEVVVKDDLGYVIDTTADYYTDTVTFHLSNPAQPDSFQYFERAVSPNGNEFKLIWE